MIKKKLQKIPILILIFLISLNQVVFAKENVKRLDDGSIEKSFSYIGSSKYEKSGNIKEDISIDNTKYKLKDIKYNSKKLSVKEKVESKDKKDYRKEIARIIDGKEYKLKAEPNIEWKKKNEEISIEEKIEYKDRNSIPLSIEKEGLNLELKSVNESSRRESFTAPAIFESYSQDATRYIFNGKVVDILGSSPIWSNYEADIKAYLGVNGNDYTIQRGYFTEESRLVDESTNRYERIANYEGTKVVPFFVATFEYKGEVKDEDATYEAEINYASDKYYSIEAKAIYEKYSLISKVIKVGAGVLVLAIITSLVIYFIKRKKKESSDE